MERSNIVQIFVMIKNEEDIISDWILHHSKIVGLENLFIIDNGSTDKTIEILDSYKEKGLKYIVDTTHFDAKEKILAKHMRCSKADIVIPLDCDELLIYDDGEKIITSCNFIKEYLSKLELQNNYFIIRKFFDCIPTEEAKRPMREINKFFQKCTFPKAFCPQKIFFKLKKGMHQILIKDSVEVPPIKTNISIIHFHYRNTERNLISAKQKLDTMLGPGWTIEKLRNTRIRTNRHIKSEYINYIETGKFVDIDGETIYEINLCW